ncbi:MAG: hypothetical protein Q8K67_11645 [Geothrix sp.]|nr:hypothetical protein [Geothrix sp.]
MQNELKTSTTGTVMTVHVQEGATVETGAILITVVAPEALNIRIPGSPAARSGRVLPRGSDLHGKVGFSLLLDVHTI